MKRIEVESLRDSIRSVFNVEIDYDTYEQELMKDLEYGYISVDEFDQKLTEHYSDLEKEQAEWEE